MLSGVPNMDDNVAIAEFLLEKRKIELQYARPYMDPMAGMGPVDEGKVRENLREAKEVIPDDERLMMYTEIMEKYYEVYAKHATI